MESNISRDHIALEAMKVHLAKSLVPRQTIFNRIACALGLAAPKITYYSNVEGVADFAYQQADAMIAAREKGMEVKDE